MIFSVLKRTWLLYRQNLLSLPPYFGIYSLVIALGNYGVSLLNIHRAGGFLPIFLLSPVLLLLMQRCFELVIDQKVEGSPDLGKLYRLTFFTLLLPMAVKAFFPVVPVIGGLLDLTITFACLYALGLFFLTGYLLLLNPRLSVRQIITLSCQKMKGSILPLGALCLLLSVTLIPPAVILLLVSKEWIAILVQAFFMTLLLPYFLLMCGVYAARMLSGQDARIRLGELDLKELFEEKVEQGIGAIEPEEIDASFVEEVQAIPSTEAPPKPKTPKKPRPEPARQPEPVHHSTPPTERSPKAVSSSLDWTADDQLDSRFFRDPPVEQPAPARHSHSQPAAPAQQVSSLSQLRDLGPLSFKKVFRTNAHSQLDAGELLQQILPYPFLTDCQPLVDSYRQALRGTLKKFQRSGGSSPYGAHFSKAEAEGNSFSWLMEMKRENQLISLSVELYINDPNW